MRSILAVLLILLSSPSVGDEVVSIAKEVDVNALDSALPKSELVVWINDSFPNMSSLHWKKSSCGEPYDNPHKYPDNDFPLCVDIHFTVGSCEWYGIQLLIYENESSPIPRPRIWALYFEDYSGWELVSSLSELANKVGTGKCQ